jgi:hypothetical protein
MKRLLKYEQILENLAQARAILRRNNLDQSDERFQKIINATERDGYTGVLTKYVYSDGIEIDEVLDLYKGLKEKSINLADIVRLSYDEVVDLVFTEEIDSSKGIEFMFNHSGYNVYRVRTYEDGLKINSPSWCLKTKSNYNTYTITRRGRNIVAIKNEYFKNGVLRLPVPDTYYGKNYNNSDKPEIRFGITIFPHGNYEFFDDDNKSTRTYKHIVDEISKLANDWLDKNEESSINLYTDSSYIGFYNFIDDCLGDYYGSFSNLKYGKEELNVINRLLDTKIGDVFIRDLFMRYKDEVLSDYNFTNNNAIFDILLYVVYGSENHMLAGFQLSESDISDKYIRYSYGVLKNYWGIKFILQSYRSIDSYLKELADEFYKVLCSDELYNIHISPEQAKLANHYLTVDKIENGYRVEFTIDNYIQNVLSENSKTKNITSVDIQKELEDHLGKEYVHKDESLYKSGKIKGNLLIDFTYVPNDNTIDRRLW